MKWLLFIMTIFCFISGELFINLISDNTTFRSLGGIFMAFGGCLLIMAIIAH